MKTMLLLEESPRGKLRERCWQLRRANIPRAKRALRSNVARGVRDRRGVMVLPLPAAREMCRRKACFSEGSRADREAGERTSKAKCPQGAAHERYGQRPCVPATARRRCYIDNHQREAIMITSGGEEGRILGLPFARSARQVRVISSHHNCITAPKRKEGPQMRYSLAGASQGRGRVSPRYNKELF